MLILKLICCIFDKKIIFFSFSTFLMYFEFFQNFDKDLGIAQKNTKNYSFIAPFFFSELVQHIKKLGDHNFSFFFKS
jgi:uncharacterized membrane protein